MVAFNVEAIDPVHVHGGPDFATMATMSPYVWMEDGVFHMLFRAVPPAPSHITGIIYHGTSSDGLEFKVDEKPVLAPGPGKLDIGGCEDPTVLLNGGCNIYYTGVVAEGARGRMLLAQGKYLNSLEKKGVVHDSSKTEDNVKEATLVACPDGRWRLFYEYAANKTSCVGLAIGPTVTGPWTELPSLFHVREDQWDNWHLSTGPIIDSVCDEPVMFYNGATRDARWRIGWIAFDRDYSRVTGRCLEPLLVPPPPDNRGDTDIAFAASAIERDDRIHLYYSRADQALFRAIIKRYAD